MSRKGKNGDATVTLTHSRTRDLKSITLQADIIIAAIGIPNFINYLSPVQMLLFDAYTTLKAKLKRKVYISVLIRLLVTNV